MPVPPRVRATASASPARLQSGPDAGEAAHNQRTDVAASPFSGYQRACAHNTRARSAAASVGGIVPSLSSLGFGQPNGRDGRDRTNRADKVGMSTFDGRPEVLRPSEAARVLRIHVGTPRRWDCRWD